MKNRIIIMISSFIFLYSACKCLVQCRHFYCNLVVYYVVRTTGKIDKKSSAAYRDMYASKWDMKFYVLFPAISSPLKNELSIWQLGEWTRLQSAMLHDCVYNAAY